MLSLFADMLSTATRQSSWSDERNRVPRSTPRRGWEAEADAARARLAARPLLKGKR